MEASLDTNVIIHLYKADLQYILFTGRIELITDEYLKSIGMYQVFLQHVKDHRILFDGGDLGEDYTISMAKTLGCICLVTDDIKERGPHYTLMRISDSEVIPFAFFEGTV